MRLDEYIREVGEAHAAATLQASPRAIASWRYRARRPRPAKALDIERLTGGLVTVREIYATDATRTTAEAG